MKISRKEDESTSIEPGRVKGEGIAQTSASEKEPGRRLNRGRSRGYRSPAAILFGDGPIVAALCATIAVAAPARGQPCRNDGCNFSNTYQGDQALVSVTSGIQDTALGSYALASNTSGSNNTGIGAYSMLVSTDSQ